MDIKIQIQLSDFDLFNQAVGEMVCHAANFVKNLNLSSEKVEEAMERVNYQAPWLVSQGDLEASQAYLYIRECGMPAWLAEKFTWDGFPSRDLSSIECYVEHLIEEGAI